MQQFQSPTHENSINPESRNAIDSSLEMDKNNITANFSKNDDNFSQKISNYSKMHGNQDLDQTDLSNNFSFREKDASNRRPGPLQRAEVDMVRVQNICHDLSLHITIENTQRTITRVGTDSRDSHNFLVIFFEQVSDFI